MARQFAFGELATAASWVERAGSEPAGGFRRGEPEDERRTPTAVDVRRPSLDDLYRSMEVTGKCDIAA